MSNPYKKAKGSNDNLPRLEHNLYALVLDDNNITFLMDQHPISREKCLELADNVMFNELGLREVNKMSDDDLVCMFVQVGYEYALRVAFEDSSERAQKLLDRYLPKNAYA